MALRPILVIPDTTLRQVADPVAVVDDEVRGLVGDMFATMYDAPGIGLAAPQVGVLRRVVVIDVAKRRDEEAVPQPIAMINPVITRASGEKATFEEGCLSIPDYYEEVERPAVIEVSYLDRDGRPASMEAEGILAVCIQHEIDHLDGVLFVDHISRLKRARVLRRFAKVARRDEGAARPASDATRA